MRIILILLLSISFMFASCNKKVDSNNKKNEKLKIAKKNVVPKKRKVYKSKLVRKERLDKKLKSSKYIKIEKRKDLKLDPDKKLENYLKPYRTSLKKKTEEVIADLKIDLTKSGSSSSLGRFASQVILEKARLYSKLPVDFAVLNSGGLRKPLYKGELKVKDIYELMPFDNHVVVVSVKGSEVKKMCKEIIRHKGLPMANISITTGETNGDTCKVGNKTINIKKDYLVATINYLYKVGEGVPSLKNGKIVKNMTNRLFRDAIIEYVKEKKVISEIIPIQYKVMRK